MILSDHHKRNIRKLVRAIKPGTSDINELYEYIEKISEGAIEDAIWHNTIGSE